jgi:hypothetical protein
MDEEKNAAGRREAKITGVINVGNSGIIIQAHKDDLIKLYGTPDKYGKAKTVDFQETKTDTEYYVNYWVY